MIKNIRFCLFSCVKVSWIFIIILAFYQSFFLSLKFINIINNGFLHHTIKYQGPSTSISSSILSGIYLSFFLGLDFPFFIIFFLSFFSIIFLFWYYLSYSSVRSCLGGSMYSKSVFSITNVSSCFLIFLSTYFLGILVW